MGVRMAQSIELLQPEDRVTHYRAMASEIRYLASEAQFDEVRKQFLEFARSLLSKADKMERGLIERERLPRPASRNWLNVA